jgi:hypothetical protein
MLLSHSWQMALVASFDFGRDLAAVDHKMIFSAKEKTLDNNGKHYIKKLPLVSTKHIKMRIMRSPFKSKGRFQGLLTGDLVGSARIAFPGRWWSLQ